MQSVHDHPGHLVKRWFSIQTIIMQVTSIVIYDDRRSWNIECITNHDYNFYTVKHAHYLPVGNLSYVTVNGISGDSANRITSNP